jgi:hypothetical protein
LSFFDEVDEPPRPEPRTSPRAASRSGPRRRRPSGTGGRRPPGDQSIQIRRAVALGALVVVVVLIAIGVHSCQVSATNSALQTYANQVSSVITRSNATGAQLFTILANASVRGPATAQNNIDVQLTAAQSELKSAKSMSVPGQVSAANRNVVTTLQMRADGIGVIAKEIQPALATSVSRSTIDDIAAGTARFYSSDVLYKDYAAPEIASALHSAGTPFAGLTGGQFLTNLEWLIPDDIATELHATIPGLTPTTIAPGLHGHKLNSVSVAGTTLQTGSTNTIPISPLPTFLLSFTNSGTNTETDVHCKVSVNGTTVSGTAVVRQTLPGHNYTCSVTLSKAPPMGTETVEATIEPVPGEKNTANNSLGYTVTFQ